LKTIDRGLISASQLSSLFLENLRGRPLLETTSTPAAISRIITNLISILLTQKYKDFPMDNLRIVVLENPQASFDSQLVKDLFIDNLAMKIRGFRQRWSQYYIPTCKTDFIGTTLMACKEVNGKLLPITSYRTIKKSQCEKYRIDFPGSTLCNNTASLEHMNALKDFIEEAQASDKEVTYSSSFTVYPWLQKEEKREAIEMLIPLFAFYHMHYQVERSIALGAAKTGTDKMYHKMGLFPIKLKGEALPSIVFPEYDNEEFEVQTLNGLTDEAIELAKSKMRLWKDRIHVKDASLGRDSVENYFEQIAIRSRFSA
jgi:hypothetical protein